MVRELSALFGDEKILAETRSKLANAKVHIESRLDALTVLKRVGDAQAEFGVINSLRHEDGVEHRQRVTLLGTVPNANRREPCLERLMMELMSRETTFEPLLWTIRNASKRPYVILIGARAPPKIHSLM